MLDDALETKIRERFDHATFSRWMGVSLSSLGDGTSELNLDPLEHHLNPGGIVHGGIIATLLDAAVGLALRTRLGLDRTHVTVNLTINYLRAHRSGRLIARGTAVRSGERTGYGEAELLDDAGRLLARANATFLVIDAPADGGPAGDAG